MVTICHQLMAFDDQRLERLKLMYKPWRQNYLFRVQELISFVESAEVADKLMLKHCSLVTKLGDKDYDRLFASEFETKLLMQVLYFVPVDVVEIINRYCRQELSNNEDKTLVITRLNKLVETRLVKMKKHCIIC